MPTYEFRCPEGHEFEKFYRKISDAVSELPCPVCGKPATRLVSGGAGLLFKGSGFYLTDYGKNAHRKSGPSSGGDNKDSASGGSKSTESSGSEAKSSDAKPAESTPSATKSEPAEKPKKPSSGTPKSET